MEVLKRASIIIKIGAFVGGMYGLYRLAFADLYSEDELKAAKTVEEWSNLDSHNVRHRGLQKAESLAKVERLNLGSDPNASARLAYLEKYINSYKKQLTRDHNAGYK